MTLAGWAWVVLAGFIVVYVAAFDTWAHFANRPSMSQQIEVWIGGPITGPLTMGLIAAVIMGLAWHWLVTK